jgi:hypothetical protein
VGAKLRGELRFFSVTIRDKTQIYSVPFSSFVVWPTFATFAEAKIAALASAPNPESIAMLTEEAVVPLPLVRGQSRQRQIQEIIYLQRK